MEMVKGNGKKTKARKSELTARERQIMKLREADLTFRQIANALGVSQPYACITYNKARQKQA